MEEGDTQGDWNVLNKGKMYKSCLHGLLWSGKDLKEYHHFNRETLEISKTVH
jgi:hypothetical protein